MKRSLRTAGGVLLATLLAFPAFAAETLKIDPVHTSVLFAIKHLNISKFYGQVRGVNGTIAYDEADPTKSKINIEIKADSVATGDEKRDAHIKGPDFFNAKQFPNVTFASKSVKKTGENEYAVTGDLTLHGQTKEVTIPMKNTGNGQDPWGKFRRGFEGAFKFNRSDFGMGFMPEALGNEVEMILSIEAVRQ
jgi:polyisoprenoid-binding protein YceI